MIMASFILPTTDNSGESIADVHSAVESYLADTYGGYTISETIGGWRDNGKLYRESGKRYDCAIQPESAEAFIAAAIAYGHMAQQLSVMTICDGKPQFHDIAQAQSRAMGDAINTLAA